MINCPNCGSDNLLDFRDGSYGCLDCRKGITKEELKT